MREEVGAGLRILRVGLGDGFWGLWARSGGAGGIGIGIGLLVDLCVFVCLSESTVSSQLRGRRFIVTVGRVLGPQRCGRSVHHLQQGGGWSTDLLI